VTAIVGRSGESGWPLRFEAASFRGLLVVTGPEDRAAAAARAGRLRAADADREQVIDLLKAAFVQGLLAKDEFGERIGRALASRTYAELAALTADIPAGGPTAPTPHQAAAPKTRRRVSRRAVAGACVLVSAVIMVIDAAHTDSKASVTANQLYVLCILLFLISFVVFACIHFTQQDPPAGQPPRRPVSDGGDTGGATRLSAPAASARALPSPGKASRDTTEASRYGRAAKPPPALGLLPGS
jgi:pyruvate/2-oxoglutarate dehydrogenase complex dihydrolipoamide acyltransferase (E2) component